MTLLANPYNNAVAVRHQFGGGAADIIFSAGPVQLSIAPSRGITFWNAISGGTQYTDLTNLSSQPISNLSADSNGYIDPFYGPPGIRVMAADVNNGQGPRAWIYTNEYDPNVVRHQEGRAAEASPLQPWVAGLANRHYATCNVVCLGDSITEGQGATSFDNRWLGRARDVLRRRYPTSGTLVGGGRGFIGCSGTGESSFTWPTTITGTPPGVTQGPKGSGGYQLNTSGQSIAFNVVGDSVAIMWTQVFGGGTFSYSVDGGATTNVSTSGTTTDGKLTSVSLGTAGSHTVTLAWVSGNADVDGVIEYYGDSASGIQFHDAGRYGWQTSNWVTTLNSGASSGPAAAIAALQPSCILINLGVNDQFSNVIPATFGTNLLNIISFLKVQLTSPYPSFVLVAMPPRQNQFTYTYPWYQYVSQMYAVAATDQSGVLGTSNVSVLDLTTGPRMFSADQDASNVLGWWHTSDLVHPSNKGHSYMGDLVAGYLSVL